MFGVLACSRSLAVEFRQQLVSPCVAEQYNISFDPR
jgi:hypothetical protein